MAFLQDEACFCFSFYFAASSATTWEALSDITSFFPSEASRSQAMGLEVEATSTNAVIAR
jgi:hypothetical protein